MPAQCRPQQLTEALGCGCNLANEMARRERRIYGLAAVPVVAAVAFVVYSRQDTAEMGRATELLASGEPNLAERLLRSMLDAEPESVPALTNLGRALFSLGRTAEALDSFEAAAAADQQSFFATYHGKYARANFMRLAKTAADASGAARGEDEGGARSEVQAAVTLLWRAIALAPTDTGAYVALGKMLQRSGAVDEAVVATETATRLAPRDAWLRVAVGEACEVAGKLEKARRSFEHALTLQPDNVALWARFSDFIADPSAVRLSGPGPDDAAPTRRRPPSPPPQAKSASAASEVASASAASAAASASVRLGVVAMTKRPLDMRMWLQYHRTVCRIDRFYLRAEEAAASLRALLAASPWDELVQATFVDGATRRDHFGQVERQVAHVASILPLARSAGVTHLLHIDGTQTDDWTGTGELLPEPPALACSDGPHFARVPPR